MSKRRAVAVALVLILTAVAARPAAQDAGRFRVFDRVEGREVAFEPLLEELSRADVLVLAGTPGDSSTHEVETHLVGRVAGVRDNGALVLEVFDRQAQEAFDHFQMGHLSGTELLAGIERPWTGYLRDYQAVVDATVASGWSIVAAAAPRPIVEAVAARGLVVLDALPANERALVAARHACADVSHPGARHLPGPYSNVAYCLESETLAESIAQAHAAGAIGGGRPMVVALVQGWRLGHLQRLAGDVIRRLPGRRVMTLDIAAVDDLQAVSVQSNDPAIPRLRMYVQR